MYGTYRSLIETEFKLELKLKLDLKFKVFSGMSMKKEI